MICNLILELTHRGKNKNHDDPVWMIGDISWVEQANSLRKSHSFITRRKVLAKKANGNITFIFDLPSFVIRWDLKNISQDMTGFKYCADTGGKVWYYHHFLIMKKSEFSFMLKNHFWRICIIAIITISLKQKNDKKEPMIIFLILRCKGWWWYLR